MVLQETIQPGFQCSSVLQKKSADHSVVLRCQCFAMQAHELNALISLARYVVITTGISSSTKKKGFFSKFIADTKQKWPKF